MNGGQEEKQSGRAQQSRQTDVLPLSSELTRKVTHIGFGLGAILLKWLSPMQAAAVAGVAVLFNWLLLPRLGGQKIARSSRGYDQGIILYPLAVLLLILLFRSRMEIAGSVWAILAFGDGAATLFGRLGGGPRLPWNQDKSILGTAGFVAVAFPVTYALSLFLGGQPTLLPRLAIVAVTVVVCAIVESLPTHVDDNLTIPIAGAFTMYALSTAEVVPALSLRGDTWIWLTLNGVLAVLGYVAKSVDLSGLLGGWLLGAVLIVCGGGSLYLVLIAFFVIGTSCTKLGYERKLRLGLAQERGGRRGFGHAFANVGVAAGCALLMLVWPSKQELLWLAAVASLATATADTTGSEVGQWLGKHAFLPLTFRRVEPGTEGAISAEGTLAGLLTGVVVSAIGVWLLLTSDVAGSAAVRGHRVSVVLLLGLAAFAGSYLESIAGSWNREKHRPIPNGVLNFFNTAVGAIAGAGLLALFVPEL